jgi:hypothetical protein
MAVIASRSNELELMLGGENGDDESLPGDGELAISLGKGDGDMGDLERTPNFPSWVTAVIVGIRQRQSTFIRQFQEVWSFTLGIQNQFPEPLPSSSLGKDVLFLGTSPGWSCC